MHVEFKFMAVFFSSVQEIKLFGKNNFCLSEVPLIALMCIHMIVTK